MFYGLLCLLLCPPITIVSWTSDRAVFGFDVVATPALLGEATILIPTVLAGSNFEIFIDYQNSHLYEQWFADPSQLPQWGINHTFDSVGPHDLTIWVSNEMTYQSIERTAHVDIGVGTLTTSVTAVNVGSATEFSVAVSNGTNLVVLIDYDNGASEETSYNDYTAVPSVFSYEYPSGGKYANASVRISNPVSSSKDTLEVYVSETMVNLGLGMDKQYYNTTDAVANITRTLDAGTLTTCVYTATNVVGELHQHYDEPYVGAYSFDYQLPGVNTYDLTVDCTNPTGDAEAASVAGVVVQDPITGFDFTDDNPIIFAFGEDLRVDWENVDGTAVSFEALYDGVASGTVSYTSGESTGYLDLTNTDYVVGGKVLRVTGSNHVSSFSKDITIHVDREIMGFNVSQPTEIYFEPGTRVPFRVEYTDGSRLAVDFDYEHSALVTVHSDAMSGPGWFEDIKTYNNTGYYYTNVSLGNRVSSFSEEIEIGIEIPIVDVNTTMIDSIETGLITGVFIVVNLGDTFPVPVFIDFDYGDGETETVEVDFEELNNTYEHCYEFSTGIFNVSMNVRNNMSAFISVKAMTQGYGIINATLTKQHPQHIAVGDVVYFNAHTDEGSNVVYQVDFGDGQTSAPMDRTETVWIVPDDTTINHTYTTPGTYSVYLEAYNVLESKRYNLPDALTVLAPIEGLSVTANATFVRPDQPVHFTVSVTRGSLVTTTVDFDDSTDTSAVSPTFFDAVFPPVTFQHGYTTVGNYTPKFNSSNDISSLALENLTIVVQSPIDAVHLAANSPVAYPDGVATFNVTLIPGSSVPSEPFCHWRFPDSINRTTFAPSLGMDQSHLESKIFSSATLGTYTTYVYCNNMISETSLAQVNVTLQARISNADVVVAPAAIAVGEEVTVQLTVSNGSHLSYDVHFGDGVSEKYIHPSVLNCTVFSIAHVYPQPGNYSVTAEVSNGVDKVTLSSPEIVVQLPVTEVRITAPAVVVAPPGEVTFQVDVPAGVVLPDDAFITWSYGVDSTVVTTLYAPELSTGQPFRHTYVFTGDKSGNITVTANVSNLISHVQQTTVVQVQLPVKGLEVNVSKEAVMVGEEVTFAMFVAWGTHVTFAIDYGDGEPREEQFISGSAGGILVSFKHTYNDVTNYSVEVVAINAYTSNKEMRSVVVQNPIVHANIELAHDDPIGFPDGDIAFELAVDSAQPVPTNVHVDVDFGDGTLEQEEVSTWPLQLSHRYTEANIGNNLAQFTLYNLVSTDHINATFVIQRMFSGFKFRAMPDAVIVGANFAVEVELEAGSHASLSVDFGTETKDVPMRDSLNATVTFLCSAAGEHQIVATISNGVDTGKITDSIKAFYPVLGYQVQAATPFSGSQAVNIFTFPGGDLALVISPGDVLPTDAQVEIDWGDGSTTSSIPAETSAAHLDHNYNGIGTYHLQVTVRNQVSQENYTFSVVVMAKVDSGLSFDVFQLGREEAGSPDTLIFSPGTPLVFVPTNFGTTHVRYDWSFSEETTNETRTQHVFEMPGDYVVRLTATNPVTPQPTGVTVERHVVISAIDEISAFDVPDVLMIDDTGKFNVTLQEVAGDVCMRFFLNGPESETVWFSAEQTFCSVDEDFLVEGFVQKERSLIYRWQHVFHEPGNYMVEVVLLKQHATEPPVPLSRRVLVQDYPCESPNVTLKKPPKADAERATIRKSEPITISTELFLIVPDCQATQDMDIRWSLLDVGSATMLDLTFLEAELLANAINIPAKTLDYGSYKLDLVVSMKDLPDKVGWASYEFDVVGSPLKAAFATGEYRLVGNGKEITFDAAKDSLDPDTGTNNGLSYAWLCSRESEAQAMKTALGELTEGMGLTKLVDLMNAIEHVIIPTPPSERRSGDRGCFGDNPGVLTAVGGRIKFDTEYMEAGLKYEVMVVVSEQVTQRWSRAVQVVEVQPGDPPTVSLECRGIACMKKLNPLSAYSIQGKCESCVDSGKVPEYEWFLSLKDNTDQISLVDALQETFISGTTKTAALTLPADFLQGGEVYELRLEVRVHGALPGKSILTLHVDKKPHSGSCQIQPPSGEALKTYAITCSGWEAEAGLDGDNNDLSYKYEYQIQGETTTLASSEAKLPPGDAQQQDFLLVVVRIVDFYKTTTEYPINIQVTPPTADDALEKEAENLESMSAEQKALNFGSTLSAIGAMSNMLDTQPEPEPEPKKPSEGPQSRRDLIKQQQLKEEQERKRLEEEKKNNQMLAKLMNSLASMSESKTVKLTDEQQKAMMSNMATMAKKMTKNAPVDALIQSLDFASSGSQTAADMSPEDRKEAMQANLEIAQSVLQKMDLEAVIEEKPVEEDTPMTEEEEEAAKLEAERLKKEEEAKKKAAAAAMSSMVGTMGDSMRANIEENSLEKISSGDIELQAILTSSRNLDGKTFESEGGATLELPEMSKAAPDAGNGNLFFEMVWSEDNFLTQDVSAQEVNSGLMQCSLTDDDGAFVAVDISEDPLKIDLADEEAANNHANTSNATRPDDSTGMTYFNVPIEVAHDALIMDLESLAVHDTVEVYIKLNASDVMVDKPTNVKHDLFRILPNNSRENPWVLLIPEELIHPPSIYIGILPVNVTETTTDPPTQGKAGQNTRSRGKRAADVSAESETLNVTGSGITSVLTRCRAWDNAKLRWTSTHCKVGENSVVGKTKCHCKTMTEDIRSYAAGFTMPQINTIDFNAIFNNFAELLTNNPAVFATVFTIMALYLLLCLWARRADRRDVERWGVRPLLDNRPDQQFCFKVSVYTGLRKNAGTKSRLSFIITGDAGETGVRVLEDGKGKYCTRGSVRHFLLTTDTFMGSLTYLRIWHDNSGEWDHASWFLDKIVVEDIQQNNRYFFMCGQWLAVDEADEQVDRILPVANQEEVEGMKHLFFTKVRRNLFDDHLWLSVASRPTRSNFTRLQRLTCVVMLIYTTMLINAMWYKAEEGVQGDQMLKIGPLVISASTMLVSLFSALMLVPINILIVALFRKSRPKGWEDVDEDAIGEGLEGHVADRAATANTSNNNSNSSNSSNKKKRKRWWRKKYPLPYWAAYIAWVIAIGAILSSATIVIFYSLQWEKEVAETWLSSLFFATIQSVVLIQPIKILFLAMFLSLLFRTLEDEEEKEEKKTNTTPSRTEQLEMNDPIIQMEKLKMALVPNPPSAPELTEAKERRDYENRMWSLIKEIIFYIFFLFLVCFIAWGTYEKGVFKMNRSIHGLFEGNYPKIRMKQINDGFKFWNWTEETLIPSLYMMHRYNGNPTTLRDRKFLADHSSFRVGAVRMRQVRMLPGSCELLKKMEAVMKECVDDYSLFSENDFNYTAGWVRIDNATLNSKANLTREEKAFRYLDALTLRGIPYWGYRNTYGGGGFVAELGTSERQARHMVAFLRENDWVDYYTRAVFVEFTIYNANVNLFAYVNLLMELTAMGGVMPFPRVMTFRLYNTLGGMATMLLIAQAAYVFVLIYFVVREVLKFRADRRNYFADVWNIVEIVLISLSVSAIAMLVMKEGFGRLVMNSLKEDREAYTNYMAFAQYEELYSYVVGGVVFCATLKFLRLLRFNKHVAHLGATLQHAKVELGHFCVTFFVLMSAFGCWAYLLMGTTVKTFSSFITTMEALYSMLIGKFNYGEMHDSNRLLGPWFFVTYCVVVFFILVNLFLGIIGTAYYEVRLKPELQMDDYRVIGFIWDKFLGLFGKNKKEKEMGAGYVDHIDTLTQRLDSLDAMLTLEYRRMLGLEADALGGSSSERKEGLTSWAKSRVMDRKVKHAWT